MPHWNLCNHHFFILIVITILSGCSSGPKIVNYSEKFTGHGNNEVYIVSHGWHTGFVFDAQAIKKMIPELKSRFDKSKYIEFGWGDKGFYQAKEITSNLTLRAIFWPTESVIHSVAVPHNVKAYFANSKVETLCMTDSEFLSLVNFISGSFYRDSNGNIIALKNGIYGNSQFYKGVGDYYLMNTCNKWTAKGLKSAGMDICPTFKLTSESIMSYVKAYIRELTISTSVQSTESFKPSIDCH